MKTKQSGVSLVELMVGITVGMVVAAGASTLAVSQLGEHKRLTLETQTQQELRAAAEIITRELRRAGSWGSPARGLWSPSNPSPLLNPYREISLGDGQIEFSYSNVLNPATMADDNLLSDDEVRGFRLSDGELRFSLGRSNYQPLTDRNTLTITRFAVSQTQHTSSLAASCPLPCVDPDLCPRVTVRTVRVELEGAARHDPAIRRNLDFSTRIHTDLVEGTCPS